jgi:surfeit locus 1 family protein
VTALADRERGPRSTRTLLVVAVLALVGIAGLTALGFWQLERREWKLHLIDQVEQRVNAVAVATPGPAGWSSITSDTDEYRHVRATGHFRNDQETLVQAVTERGSGFWVLTPMVTDQGFTVLVNRGFVPSDKRMPAARVAGQIDGEMVVTGLLRVTEPGGGFLRGNDAPTDHWYSRDVGAIAVARQLTDAAPYFIDADATPNAGGLPVGGLTVVAFPNNHLIYALTWFVLALMLVGAVAFVAMDEWRLRGSFRALRDANEPNAGV